MSQENDLIVGCEREILIKFLTLIKDKFPIADKANYFLETNGISGINVTITNQRDILSHLRSCLDSEATREQKLSQLNTAEEHLRRSIIEPYQIAVRIIKDQIQGLLEPYKEKVLSHLFSQKEFQHAIGSAPNMLAIQTKIDTADSLSEEARKAKSRNLWDVMWEEGVRKYVEAFQILTNLKRELEDYLFKATQLESSTKQSRWTIGGIVISIVVSIGLFILGIVYGDSLKLLFKSITGGK